MALTIASIKTAILNAMNAALGSNNGPAARDQWANDVATAVRDAVVDAVPAGGAAGQVLTKTGPGDHETAWVPAPGGGSGTVTSVAFSSAELDVTGSPVTSNGTITAALKTQPGVSAGSYGGANIIPSITVNAKGIVTSVSDTDIALPISQIQASGTPSASTFLRGDGTWSVPGGAADPWTIVRLANDFVTSSASAVDVTGLFFTPAANKRYEFYGKLLLRTATTTVGPRPGIAWPTGLSDGAVQLLTPSSATANLSTNGNISAAVLVAVGGLPTTTASWLGTIDGFVIAGASPSGNLRIQLASETAGTNVTIRAGSFIAYREIP